MRLLFIEPSQYRNLKAGRCVHRLAYPPIGLASLAAMCRDQAELSFLDVSNSSLSEVQERCSRDCDAVLFTVTSFSYYDARDLACDHFRDKNTRLIIGGPHISIEGAEVFSSGPWHMAVEGEGEPAIREILRSFPEVPDAPGVLAPGRTGAASVRIRDLDSLPWPDYSIMDMSRYMFHSVLTSRGCPFVCSFCAADVIWKRKWYCRSIPDVVDEMEDLREKYGDKVFHVNDDNLTLRRDRAYAFAEELLSRGRAFRWVAQGVRADRVDRGLLRHMRRAGCERISIGVESADPGVLAAMGKQEHVETIERAIWMARDAGLDVLSMFIIGSVAETPQSMERTFDFVRKNTLHPVDFYQLVPYPGTGEWERIREQGTLLFDDYRNFNHYSHEPAFETPLFSAQQRRDAYRTGAAIARDMDRKWYIRKHVRRLNPLVFLRLVPGDMLGQLASFAVLPVRAVRRVLRRLSGRGR